MSNPDIGEYGKGTQWKKGESGNPFGRKKGSRNFTSILKRILSTRVTLLDPLEKDAQGNPVPKQARIIDHICNSMIVKAINGDTKAFQLICDRVDGKPFLPVEHSGDIDINHQLSITLLKKSFAKLSESDGDADEGA